MILQKEKSQIWSVWTNVLEEIQDFFLTFVSIS